jgi:signal transduction histidine kinase
MTNKRIPVLYRNFILQFEASKVINMGEKNKINLRCQLSAISLAGLAGLAGREDLHDFPDLQDLQDLHDLHDKTSMSFGKFVLFLQYIAPDMIRLIALIISIVLQIIAASIALRFMKLTKYRLSWILLSIAFVFMALRKIFQLFEFFRGTPSYTWQMIDYWLDVIISFMIITGVVLIRELFYSIKRADIDRMKSEKRVISAIINTEENERKRFAKDLHDGLGPLMSTVKMSLSALGGRITDPTDTVILNNTNHLINEAINTLKDVSNNLSPHILSNFGVSSALSAFIAKINQTRAIEIDFKSNMQNSRIDPEKEVVMYRAACELINNSIRHSGASKIEIELNRLEKFITLQFSDNGRGFDTASLGNEDNEKGMGLSNIETRVKSVDGVFILESNPGKGTSALIKMIE